MQQLKYIARARFCGNVEWLCPNCGTLNKHRLGYTGGQPFECRGRNCSRRYHAGLKLWLHTRQGSAGFPMLGEAFPVVDVAEWWRRRLARRKEGAALDTR